MIKTISIALSRCMIRVEIHTAIACLPSKGILKILCELSVFCVANIYTRKLTPKVLDGFALSSQRSKQNRT